MSRYPDDRQAPGAAPSPGWRRRRLALLVDQAVRVGLLGWGAWFGLAVAVDAQGLAPMDALYNHGIEDACDREHAEVVGGLIPIARETTGLVWSDQDELLVVAWKNPEVYKKEWAERNEASLDTDKLLWVTPAPQVQHYCQAALRADPELGDDDLALRLSQYLGLPPLRGNRLFVELWVKPQDLFRPCVDPETSDDRCALTPGETPATVKNISDYTAFYERLRKTSCEGDNLKPWTGLGYTYHWGNAATKVGASELLFVPGAHYRVAGTSDTRAYCSTRD